MKVSIVLGAGLGDEGKGNFVNHLSKSAPYSSLVVRFNGGHQAGHTVVHNGIRHVFSNFGSGTLVCVPTYWSKYCTVYPPGFNREYDALFDMGISIPQQYVDPMCPVTTPFDIDVNRSLEAIRDNPHGTCGVGFGQTVLRHETLDHSYRIFVKDLMFPWILRNKLIKLGEFYNALDVMQTVDLFMESCQVYIDRVVMPNDLQHCLKIASTSIDNIIFEGAQGILLDREHGIFPHVTRSHTTSKNVFEMLPKKWRKNVDIFYMTRCYSTRHGDGPFFSESVVPDNPHETNVSNRYQGHFRIAPFSIQNVKYAITTDSLYNWEYSPRRIRVVTCVDQFEKIPAYHGDDVVWYPIDDFKMMFPENTVFVDRPDY